MTGLVVSHFGITQDQLDAKLKPLQDKLDKFIERDETYKRKLLKLMSEMYSRQEMTIDVYDGLKAFVHEWFGKE